MQHDGLLTIAIGKHRHETKWKNKELLWSELVHKLETTHRTAETLDEYLAASKERQSEIKDVGGFVGGYIRGGRRKNGSISFRSSITLDIDFAGPSFWEDFTFLYDNAAVLYSTHKHSPDKPRLRLVMPLDKPVQADQYEAIARRIAGNLGIELFDPTSFQPTRLMYWPSTPRDGEYLYRVQDGKWLDTDAALASYTDWTDTSQWPISSKVNASLSRAIKKQGDPLEKPGIIGAFCRVYSIQEAIAAYLPDIYAPCDQDDRYTYMEGSTSAGLVVYEDKYAYSHHGTDPTSGKLCNAFDLVRLHKYGLKDEDVNSDTPVNRLPSYMAMTDLGLADTRVKKQLAAERLAGTREDFGELDQEEDADGSTAAGPADEDWLTRMDMDRKGNFLSTTNNVLLILENDPALRGRIALNLFEKREVALKDLPWRKVTPATRELTDTDTAASRHYLEHAYKITGRQKIDDAIAVGMLKSGFHPVKDYLLSRVWDRKPRVDTLLVDYLGAEDSDYTRTVTRKALVACVARILRPGVKFDNVLTLVGPQGIGKSTLLKKLGRQWFSDSFTTVQGKEAIEAIQGAWLIEIGELAGLRKHEFDTVKHFLSKTEDRYRVAYGRRTETFPRQCVFFGTTNSDEFLTDPTGNRRFWISPTALQEPSASVWDDLNGYEVDQVWAEAVSLYNDGETLFLGKDMAEEAARVQAAHNVQDERAGLVKKYLETLVPENWEEMDLYQRRSFLQGDELAVTGTVRRQCVTIAEIWCECFGGMQREMNTFNTKSVHDIMSRMDGWERAKYKRRTRLYGQQRAYEITIKTPNNV